MKLYSKFSPGDKVWCIKGGNKAVELTVGQVNIKVTDSPGTSKETIFDNYRPLSGRVESYMCVETGIHSGSVYVLGRNIFATKNEVENAILTFKKKGVIA
jgi:hypothetical protein